ncbi:anti-sigma factor [Abyssalbus ytuae]|uniref:Anti-sigma factor n=1 Tax=Abyssalbus ytuae TaxID=2926907 RepID=A0A9E6ZM24_9FLAO|nr:anti-sigma factor [Abyssalbus ytuae]UOB18299.1 anti-sigma factor [Abyssalbus ytuae]
MIRNVLIAVFLVGLMSISCNNDDDGGNNTESNIYLNLNGLESLGSDFIYEGWIIVNGTPISTGTFTVNSSGQLSQTLFPVNAEMLEMATTFVLSIEPAADTDPAPAETKILVGDFAGNSATVSTSIVGNFSSSSGKYILATPTNGGDSDENSGIWFLDLTSGSPAVGLDLPDLPAGWKYEGWAVINGVPVTSGKFTDVNAADEFDGFSSTMNPGPPFPGEDYLINAPNGLNFPVDLSGGLAVISIEPEPDNSPAPFTLKPLAVSIPENAADHETYEMMFNEGSFPSGTVSR